MGTNSILVQKVQYLEYNSLSLCMIGLYLTRKNKLLNYANYEIGYNDVCLHSTYSDMEKMSFQHY